MPSSRLILLAHGSTDPGWRIPFEELAASLEQATDVSAVRLAFMQLASPSLADVVAEAAGDGVDRLKILPVFLSAGAHVERDIPELVTQAQAEHPAVDIRLLPAVGTDPRMGLLLRTLALEAASQEFVSRVKSCLTTTTR